MRDAGGVCAGAEGLGGGGRAARPRDCPLPQGRPASKHTHLLPPPPSTRTHARTHTLAHSLHALSRPARTAREALRVCLATTSSADLLGVRRELLPWMQWHAELGVTRFYVRWGFGGVVCGGAWLWERGTTLPPARPPRLPSLPAPPPPDFVRRARPRGRGSALPRPSRPPDPHPRAVGVARRCRQVRAVCAGHAPVGRAPRQLRTDGQARHVCGGVGPARGGWAGGESGGHAWRAGGPTPWRHAPPPLPAPAYGVTEALRLACEEGQHWLMHLDPDELVHPGGPVLSLAGGGWGVGGRGVSGLAAE